MMPTPTSNAGAVDDDPCVAVKANPDGPPQLALIAALARNRVIGRNNGLPWHLPADLRFFKQTTMGKPLLMGRRTWESIGRPLPGRRMIVLTGDPTYRAEGCAVAHSLREALILLDAASEIMVIGGAALFEQTLPLAGRLYLTRVEADVPGDVWFPEWDARHWRLVWEEAHPADTRHAWSYRFQRWERRGGLSSEIPLTKRVLRLRISWKI